MIDFIVGAILVGIVGLALAYIIRSGKNGIKCVGCPDAKNCCSCSQTAGTVSGGCGGSCTGCSSHTKDKE